MKTLLVVVVFLFVSPLVAQQAPTQEIAGFGGEVEDRGSTRVLYWNTKLDGPAGQFAIEYGRPVRKKEYEDPAKFDALTKGKVWRMGKDFWTLLDSSLPLKVSGKAVAPGYYFLGLRRSADGAHWYLAFIDPVKARAARLDAFVIEKAAVEFEAPVKVENTSAIADKLSISLSYQEKTPTQVTMKAAWGNLVVTAPIEVSLAK